VQFQQSKQAMKNIFRYQLTISIALLTILALSGCGKKADEGKPSSDSGGTSTTAPSGGTGTSDSPGNPTTGASTDGTLSAEAKKLGVTPQGATTCPGNALVKGVVTKKRGNIYHAPKSLDYEKVKPNICFADTATAEKAGFSIPK
jgi:predicted small lipoprotein YifL